MYRRALELREIVTRKSVFLFGPRQTGKSTLVRQAFPDAAVYDLLEADTFRELTARPEYLRQTLSPRQTVLIVDEVHGRVSPIADRPGLRGRAISPSKRHVFSRKGLMLNMSVPEAHPLTV